MGALQIFENVEFGKIRTTVLDGEPWFVGKDVATALGYKDAPSVVSDHVDIEDRKKGMDGRFASPSIEVR